uniref:NUC domain-containing protein n=1 Tax=Mesocestoides corti TaxID=53468 RepID=A0A5K3F6U7_MESCO
MILKCICFIFCTLKVLQHNIGEAAFVSPSSHQKIVLISAQNIALTWSGHSDHNLSAFDELLQNGCLIHGIPIDNITSSMQAHSLMLSGGSSQETTFNNSREMTCDKLIFSKIKPTSEPLWLTNQRHGHQSASYFWPEDYISVNGSRPFKTAGINPSTHSAYFNIDQIIQWLLSPAISLVDIFIPPTEGLHGDYISSLSVEYTNAFLSSLLSHIKNHPKLNSSVSFVFVGGFAVANSNSDESPVIIEDLFKSTRYFNQYLASGHNFEVWLPPYRENESLRTVLAGKNSDFITCNTSQFLERFPQVDVGVLPPYYLVAKPGKMLFLRKQHLEEAESAYVILSGPAFNTSNRACKKTAKHHIQLTDVYPLVCWALGLTRPWPHSGHLARVSHLLRKPPTQSELDDFNAYATGRASSVETGLFMGISASTLISGSIIASFAIVFGLLFVSLAVKYGGSSQTFRGGVVRFASDMRHRRRRFRPAGGESLLGDSSSNRGVEDDDEEEVVVSTDALRNSFAGKNDSQAFLQMLHSPTVSGTPRTAPLSTNL